MRSNQTKTEKQIRGSIKPFLKECTGLDFSFDESITDSPDFVIEAIDGHRVGVEATTLIYERFMKWSSKKIEDGCSRKAEVVVDLDKQIEASLKKKNKKYKDYKRNRKLKEVWLCFHNDIYELSDDPARIMNKRDFIGDAWFYLKKHRCKYDRVFFFPKIQGITLKFIIKKQILTLQKGIR